MGCGSKRLSSSAAICCTVQGAVLTSNCRKASCIFGLLSDKYVPQHDRQHHVKVSAHLQGLYFARVDTTWVIARSPQLLQASFTAITDIFIYKLARLQFGQQAARYTCWLYQLHIWVTAHLQCCSKVYRCMQVDIAVSAHKLVQCILPGAHLFKQL